MDFCRSALLAPRLWQNTVVAKHGCERTPRVRVAKRRTDTVIKDARDVGNLAARADAFTNADLHVAVGRHLRGGGDEVERGLLPPFGPNLVENQRYAASAVCHGALHFFSSSILGYDSE